MQSFFKKPYIIVLLVLIIDQALKIWVKTHMMLGEEFSVIGDWFMIHFIENNGMAFGMELAGKFGKVILSVFRIVAVIGIGYYLYQLTLKKAPTGLIVSISLVLAGALGNIIDSAFYGLIFNDSYPQVATMFPPEGGYAPFLHGKVVDMFYFPLIEGNFPQWFPFWGGDRFVFFRPVFNVADSAITIGIVLILIFQRKYFK
ncbi:lipoprotein signal peptidase [Labilibacter sediminis]|nr:lipoprotein signal peptidase [Labilibacter sediminis]